MESIPTSPLCSHLGNFPDKDDLYKIMSTAETDHHNASPSHQLVFISLFTGAGDTACFSLAPKFINNYRVCFREEERGNSKS